MLVPTTGTGEGWLKNLQMWLDLNLWGEPLDISKEPWSLRCPSLKLECP